MKCKSPYTTLSVLLPSHCIVGWVSLFCLAVENLKKTFDLKGDKGRHGEVSLVLHGLEVNLRRYPKKTTNGKSHIPSWARMLRGSLNTAGTRFSISCWLGLNVHVGF